MKDRGRTNNAYAGVALPVNCRYSVATFPDKVLGVFYIGTGSSKTEHSPGFGESKESS